MTYPSMLQVNLVILMAHLFITEVFLKPKRKLKYKVVLFNTLFAVLKSIQYNLLDYYCRRFLDFGWYFQFCVLDSLQSGKQIKSEEFDDKTIKAN